jgi:hypothetical protein
MELEKAETQSRHSVKTQKTT